MPSVKPKYVIALAVVVVFAAAAHLLNPYKKYSTRQFWQTATLAAVAQVPVDALKVGNKNGGVLMWAAMGTSDPDIIKALVARGAQVNEADRIFGGTPLTAAAGYASNPEIIRALVNAGADINQKVNNGETALLIAAQYNHSSGIIETLVALGANLNDRTEQGESALDLAKNDNNPAAEAALLALTSKN